MKLKIKNIFKLLLFASLIANSQSLPLPANIQSPNAANLGKYGDLPVSFYSGTPNVNIPLHTMQELGVKLEVSLDYDASGVRVSSLPSWVGQNWSLNAGGVITRSPRGFQDEFYVPLGNTLEGFGYFYPISHQRLNVGNWNDLNFLNWLNQSNLSFDNNTNVKDSEPDIFTFNFMGHTGKFFMGEDGQWKVASESNLKIIINEADFTYPFGSQTISNTSYKQTKLIGKIEVIDDAGIIYTFGSSPSAIEYSVDFFGQRPNYWQANSWYLTKVRTHYGKILYTLDYERGPYIGEFYNHTHHNVFNAGYVNGIFQGWISGCYFSYGRTAVQGTLISPVYLRKITPLSGQELNFNRLESSNRVYNPTGALNQAIYDRLYGEGVINNSDISVLLYYFYHLREYRTFEDIINKLKWQKLYSITGATNITFTTNGPSYPTPHTQRLNLLEVAVNGRSYKLEYDRFDQLPEPISRAVDHLGYYNGTQYAIANNAAGFASHYSQRSTHFDLVKIGSLKKIIYPTKGSTEFVYGPHRYSRYVSDDKTSLQSVSESTIGGLRIEQIKNDDGKGNIEIKNYKYIKNYASNPNGTASSGILSNLPKYYWTNWRTKSAPGGDPGELSENVFSTNPIIPLGNYFGSAIGYSEVAEVLADGSYTLYKFTSNEDPQYRDETFAATFNVSPSPYEASNDRSLLRGKLIEKSVYNSSNLPVERTSSSYSANNGATKFVKGSNITGISCATVSGGMGYGFNRGNAYKIYYFDNSLVYEEKISFLGNQQLKTTSQFSYGYYPSDAVSHGDNFLRSTTKQVYLQSNETGNERKEVFVYYPFNISSAINTELVSKRIFGPLVTENRKNGEIIDKSQIEYGYFAPVTNANWPLPKKSLASKGTNVPEEKIIIDSYDSNGNVSEYHVKDGIYTIMIYGYKKRYPIIKIEGPQVPKGYAEMKAVAVESLLNASASGWSSSHTQILNFLQEVRAYYASHQVTTYTYKPGIDGIMSMTDPKGYSTFYNYDSYGRLSNTKDAAGNIIQSYNYNYKAN